MKAAKAVSAAILEGPVPLCCDFGGPLAHVVHPGDPQHPLRRGEVPLQRGQLPRAVEVQRPALGGAAVQQKGLGAVPVVTTATDVNGRFSVDAWAARQGLFLDSMKAAKAVSAGMPC